MSDLDTVSRLNFVAPWPLWLIVVGVLLGGASVVFAYRGELTDRRWRWLLTSLRWAALGTVLAMSFGWSRQLHQAERPILVVAVDVSESMAAEDRYADARRQRASQTLRERAGANQATRLTLARGLLLGKPGGWWAELSERYRVELFFIGEEARRVELPPPTAPAAPWTARDRRSLLGRTLQTIVDYQRGQATAALVLLTDGACTDQDSLAATADSAAQAGLRWFVVGIGDEQPVRDLALESLLLDDLAFVGDRVEGLATVRATGLPAEPLTVRLRDDDSQELLAEASAVTPAQDGTVSVPLSFAAAAPGDRLLRVEVVGSQPEPNANNNQRKLRLRVRDDTLTILLAAATPSYEFRFLRHLLERATKPAAMGSAEEAQAFDVHVVLQDAATVPVSGDSATASSVPEARRDELLAELDRYDGIILCDPDPQAFSSSFWERLTDYVRRDGGGLLLSAGGRFEPAAVASSPLSSLLPLDAAQLELPPPEQTATNWLVRSTRITPHGWSAIFPSATDVARHSGGEPAPLTVRWLPRLRELPAELHVLLEAAPAELPMDATPFLVQQFVGRGRVLWQLSDETYLWSRQADREHDYEQYWLWLVRYLARSRQLADDTAPRLRLDRERVPLGEALQVHVTLSDRDAPADDQAVVVQFEHANGDRRQVPLRRAGAARGEFTGTVDQLAAGQYLVELAAPTLAQPPRGVALSVDPLPTEATAVALQAAALRAAAARTNGRYYALADAARLPRDLPAGRSVTRQSLPPRSLWNSPWLVLAVVALLGVEWLLRRWHGLL